MQKLSLVILLVLTLLNCGQGTENRSEIKSVDSEPVDVSHISALLDQSDLAEEAKKRVVDYFGQNQNQIENQKFITVIDFTQPSTAKRYYLFDVENESFSQHLVAHGKNSGGNYATSFSNISGSNQSSLGIYLTGKTYWGSKGYSLNLHGQESTNDKAYQRRVVIHSASYVSESFIAKYGRLGRSWGCPALSKAENKKIINKIKNGSLLFIYGK